MGTLRIVWVLACAAGAVEVLGAEEAQEPPELPMAEVYEAELEFDTLVWADEFEKDGMPDERKWGYVVGGHGFGNRQLQYYTERRAKNARVEDGLLVIEAHREPYQENAYTSARLSTFRKAAFLYGQVDIRARMPSGDGTWVALWMMAEFPGLWQGVGWPLNGEVDLLEYAGDRKDRAQFTIHTAAYNHIMKTHRAKVCAVPGAEEEFHLYRFRWYPGRLEWYVDGELCFTFENDGKGDQTTWPFDRPFHLIVDLSVGGNFIEDAGAEVDPEIWPQRLEIDYVRVYQ